MMYTYIHVWEWFWSAGPQLAFGLLLIKSAFAPWPKPTNETSTATSRAMTDFITLCFGVGCLLRALNEVL